MNSQTITYTLAAASANNIALSQTPGGAGDLTLNGSTVVGGVAILDTQRRVAIASAGNDSGRVYTVYGTRLDGGVISENVTGPNATTVSTVQDFKTVTRVSINGAAAGANTVGTSGAGATPWEALDPHKVDFRTSFACIVTGTVNYDIQICYEDPNGPLGAWPAAPVVPTGFGITGMTGKTSNAEVTLTIPCWGWRLVMNSGTGSVKTIATQEGIRS